MMKNKVNIIGSLISEIMIDDALDLKKEYRKRNSSMEKIKVPNSSVNNYVNENWSVSRELKKDSWLEREKKHNFKLTDDLWAIFYRMGYRELASSLVKLPYGETDDIIKKKQVDIIAKDDETVLIVECKSSLRRGRRNLQKDLNETMLLKGEIAAGIKSHYGKEFKPKIIWVYVTKNIIWSEADINLAQKAKINVLTENEVSYY
ncbi:MAG: hypothetical protein GXP21_00800, partial [Gammaproteobacteria bacterium]|nr:hypothetical protein [Gammaproteobacteria bacterium]